VVFGGSDFGGWFVIVQEAWVGWWWWMWSWEIPEFPESSFFFLTKRALFSKLKEVGESANGK
jgi:hypothetical protein